MAHLFGPVNSRRLGLSLGVDLIPRKTCPFDCIYCEVGPTTHQTDERFDYHTEAIIRELADYLGGAGATPDIITLAGSGEPTLNLGLGRLMAAIKEMTDIPVAVLTNGALLGLPEVRDELAAADVVLPSLDAAREATFQAINRPLPGFFVRELISALEVFRQGYRGQIWLEIMLLKGLNDSAEELTGLHRAISEMAPDKVQLNTAVRPGVEASARPLSQEELEAVAAFLGAEVIATCQRQASTPAAISDAAFVELLARRPMTAPDLAQALGLPLVLVREKLRRLRESGRISYNHYEDQGFYRQ
jgi:wyosine [tRNA(Phe)-imidazoG37] synthetase (radical SAM superfamily)